MRFVFLLLAVFSAGAFAAESHDVFIQGPPSPLSTMPTFEKGYLAVYDIDRRISLYAPDGSLAYRATPQVEGASYVFTLNAGADENGSLAAAVQFGIPKVSDRSGGIVVFDPTGTQRAAINTGAYFYRLRSASARTIPSGPLGTSCPRPTIISSFVIIRLLAI